jgi:hypothetical protein
MPHWNGLIQTESPPLLDGCQGDRKCIRQRIVDATSTGVNLRAISFRTAEKKALVTLEGQEGPVRAFFKEKLEVDDPDGPFETAGE